MPPKNIIKTTGKAAAVAILTFHATLPFTTGHTGNGFYGTGLWDTASHVLAGLVAIGIVADMTMTDAQRAELRSFRNEAVSSLRNTFKNYFMVDEIAAFKKNAREIWIPKLKASNGAKRAAKLALFTGMVAMATAPIIGGRAFNLSYDNPLGFIPHTLALFGASYLAVDAVMTDAHWQKLRDFKANAMETIFPDAIAETRNELYKQMEEADAVLDASEKFDAGAVATARRERDLAEKRMATGYVSPFYAALELPDVVMRTGRLAASAAHNIGFKAY